MGRKKGFSNGRRGSGLSLRQRAKMFETQAMTHIKWLNSQRKHDEVFSLALARVARVYAKHAGVDENALLAQVEGTYATIYKFVNENKRLPKEDAHGRWEDVPAGVGVAEVG